MKSISITEARPQLIRLVDEARYQNEAALITKHGKPVAVLVGWEERQRLAGAYDEGFDAGLEDSMGQRRPLGY